MHTSIHHRDLPASAVPEILEPRQRHLRVDKGAVDAPVPEVVLDSPGVAAVVGKL